LGRFVYERLRYQKFDGVWIDDVNLYPGHGLKLSITDAEYGTAVTRWVSYVGNYIRKRGMKVWINLACNPWDPAQLANALELAPHVTGINREHWVRYGDISGPFGSLFSSTAGATPPISSLLDYAVKLQAAGALISGVDYGYTPATDPDRATMTYGRALFLLAWDGRPGSFYAYRPTGSVDAASDPRWMVDIGTPNGPCVRLTDGTYRRTYTQGVVTLNPISGHQSATIA
jgi:hypothetical protein